MEVLVFGAGSIGSLLGGLLAREHDVTLVGRDPHMGRVREHGLTITGLADGHVHPAATTDATGRSADVALVTVKSYDTGAAAEALSAVDVGAVCSLQNGLGNVEQLADALACPILGGSVTYGAELEAPGTVRMTGTGTVTIGSVRDGEAATDALVSAFEAADIAIEATDSIETTLWRKVAVNAAINPTTALTGRRNGDVAEPPLEAVAMAAAAEVVEVAVANGVKLDHEAICETVRSVAEATAENRSSMLHDVTAGTRTEIGAINGAVVERAGDVDVPVNATLAALIEGVETGYSEDR